MAATIGGPAEVPRIIVVGAGGFARETLDVIEDLSENPERNFHIVGVTDPAPHPSQLARLHRRGVRYLGSDDEALSRGEADCFTVAIGDPGVRRTVARRFIDAGMQPVTLIHPTAIIGRHSRVAEGAIVCAGVVISTNVTIGRYATVNPNATIGHDAVLDDFVSINPGAIISGEVSIGAQTLIGAGAVVLESLSVGSCVTVGAAACVTRNVESHSVVVGVPARPINA